MLPQAIARVRAGLLRMFAGLLIAGMGLSAAWSQAPLTTQQLDQLLAPIALYPDPLLGEILVAATYPAEVAEAARWLKDPYNAGLKGDPLAAALQTQDWDPSVKSLVPFAGVLQMMDDHAAWTQRLGEAFLAQQAAVMDSVQRLRAMAKAAGTLRTTPEAVVSSDGGMTSIEPADPRLLYVPIYDPTVTYGTWPSRDFQPYDLFGSWGYGTLGGGIGFLAPTQIVVPLWGWVGWDWRRHHLRIDQHRFNAINRSAISTGQRTPVTSPTWQHDASHRRGFTQREERAPQRFLGTPEPRTVQPSGGRPDHVSPPAVFRESAPARATLPDNDRRRTGPESTNPSSGHAAPEAPRTRSQPERHPEGFISRPIRRDD